MTNQDKWEEEMTEETLTPEDVINDTGGSLFENWEPEVQEDSEAPDFSKPIKGKYVCTVEELTHKKGESQKTGEPYEFLLLKLKAFKDMEGDPSYNRFLDKKYFLGESKYSDDPNEGKKKLCNDLFTAGLELPVGTTVEHFLALNEKIKGKEVFVSAFPSKDKQVVRIVKELKLKDAPKGNDAPFELS